MKSEDFRGNYGLTVVEVVQILGVCERKIRGLIAEGKIPHFKVGRSVRIPWLALQEWMDSGGTKGGNS